MFKRITKLALNIAVIAGALIIGNNVVLADTGNHVMGNTIEASGTTSSSSSSSSATTSRFTRSVFAAATVNAPSDLSSDDSSLPNRDAVDISSYQSWMTQSDFNSLKSSGVKTIVIKLTEGTSYKNPYAAQFISYAKNAGLNIAAYHYATFGTTYTSQTDADNAAVAEANYFANTAKELGLPSSTVMIEDAEEGGLPYWDWTEASLKFSAQLRSNGFTSPKYYTSKSWATDGYQMEPSKLGAKNMWVAQYLYGKPSASNLQNTSYGAWQYSSQMYFTNISQSKPVDVSVDYSNFFTSENSNPYEPDQKTGPSVNYQAQVQNDGWQPYVYDGETAGTTGRSLRMEALKVNVTPPAGMDGGVQYSAQVQNIGWQSSVSNGETAGTVGQSLEMEAVKFNLTGTMADNYDIYYRVQVRNYGWLDWAKNGEIAGTVGMGYRMEAVQIVLVPKGGAAPGGTSVTYLDGVPTVAYTAHVQNIGWQSAVMNGATAGTIDQSLRMEALKANLSGIPANLTGGITYGAHVQNIGWQSDVSDGSVIGTTGQGLQIEALKFGLTGQLAQYYDIYYRSQIQNEGWLGWTNNLQSSGSQGKGLRLEAVQVVIVPKGTGAPGNTANSFVQN